jgi:hypothetical protein
MHRTQNLTDSAAVTADLSVVTPADTLRGAALYLEVHGWFQGGYYPATTTGPFPAACALGAIGMAAHGRMTELPFDGLSPSVRDSRKAADHLHAHLADLGITLHEGDNPDYEPPANVICWNDSSGQSASKVIATLREAADRYDRTHTPGGAA